ncbi:MAG: redoxin domain-containing protein [Patescibacteria group bacterium]
MKNNIKILAYILSAISGIFFLFFLIGKSVLPDFLGNSVPINETSLSLDNEKLLDKKAPDFDLPDNTGNRVKLAYFSNTPSMLVFWSTWNTESADQIKILDDYLSNERIDSSIFNIVAINSLEDSSIVKSFIKRGGYNVSVAMDSTGYISNYYNVKSLPTTFFIDKEGIIKEIYTGVLSESMIVDKIENLLK